MSILCSMVGASFTVAAVAQILRSKKGITAVGNAQIDTAQSKFGGASALFDGTSDYLTVSPLSDFNFETNDFTVEFWIRPSSLSTDRYVIGSSTGSFGAGSIGIGTNSSSHALRFYVNSAGGNIVLDSSILTVDTWYHYALVRNGNTFTLFRNGTSVSTGTYSGTINFGNTGGLIIGQAAWVLSGTYGLAGHYDEIRISNTARYTANFTAPTAPFVNDANTLLLIHADGTDATTFFEDDNGVRAPIGIRANNQVKISTTQSRVGGSSIEYDGNDDFLTLATLPTITGDCTIEFWGRFDILPWNQTLGGGSYMIAYTRASTDYLMINRSGAGSQVNFQIATGNRYGSFTKSGVNLAINTWYHMAIVRNGGVWKAFFNGTELSTFTNDSNFTNSGRTEDVAFTTIGRFVDSRGSWDGHMDEFRVSNSARYTGDFTPPTQPFVNDANTVLLVHADGTNASTIFRDDNGVRAPKGIAAVGNAQVDTAQSQFGGTSALFDGSGDHLRAYNVGISPTENFTFEGWIRPANTGTNYHIMSITGAEGRWGVSFYQNGTTLRIYASNSYPTWNIFSGVSLGTVAANTWYHISIVRLGSTWYGSLNGTITTVGTSSATLDISGDIDIGAFVSNFAGIESFNGHIDEVRISNTARYTANFTAPTTPFQNDANTLLLLHMDGTDASTVFTDDNGVTPTHSYT